MYHEIVDKDVQVLLPWRWWSCQSPNDGDGHRRYCNNCCAGDVVWY